MSNTVFTSSTTQKMVTKQKKESFERIFRMLDSDQDGMISANAIDISNLPSELLEVLGPLFCELEDLGQALDMEEFVDALGRLYDTLSKPDKEKLLLRADKKRKVNREPDFKVRKFNLTN
jgi:Ca2+-binding EF-hand superfamily protein